MAPVSLEIEAPNGANTRRALSIRTILPIQQRQHIFHIKIRAIMLEPAQRTEQGWRDIERERLDQRGPGLVVFFHGDADDPLPERPSPLFRLQSNGRLNLFKRLLLVATQPLGHTAT